MKKLLIFSFFLSFVLFSCTKNNINDDIDNVTNDKISLLFDISSIESSLGLEASVKDIKESGEIILEDKSLGNGVYSTSSVSNKIENKQIIKNAATKTYEHLVPGTKYYTLIYKYKYNSPDSNNRILVGAGIGESGKRTPIQIERPATTVNAAEPYWYKVVAFTYNEKNEKGFPNLDSVKNLIGTNFNYQLAVPTNRAYYLYQGTYNLGLTFHVNSTDDPSTIRSEANFSLTFKPLTSKFTLNFDAQSTLYKFKEIGGVVTAKGNYKSAKVNLKDGSLILADVPFINTNSILLHRFMFNTVYNGTNYVVSNDFTPSNKVEFSTYLYANDEKSFDELGLNVIVNHLKIIDNNTLVKYNINSTTGNPLTYNFSNLKFQNKYQSFGNIYFYDGFDVGSILWSMGNLYYDKDAEGQKYKIRSNANLGRGLIESDYWKYKSLVPGDDAIPEREDPCAKLHPLGTWRLPTIAEFDNLFNLSTHNVSRHQESNMIDNVQYRYTEISKSNNANKNIRFYSFGYFSTAKSFLSEEYMALYWADRKSFSREVYTSTTTLLGSGFTGVATDSGYPVESRLNIRCVKNL